MSKFFIRRPIVAMVISILMVIVGAVTIAGLPVALFPQIAPPEIQVSAVYTGADALTVEQSVATPIEQQMSGVDNMNYMYSLNATAKGDMRLIVDFDVKTDPNTDLILAQSRTTLAASQLPAEVNNYGVTVQKTLTAPMMLVSLNSPNDTLDAQFLANYAYINLNDQLTRVPGIGSVQVFGAGQYAMRLWVKPDQLAKLGITVPEIVNAVQTQNTVNPAGQVGGEPIPKGQEFTYSVRAAGRRTSPEEFGQIVVRETPDGGIVRVKDVARVELGSQDYSLSGRFNGKASAVMAIYQLPGSNAVQAAEGVKKLMAEAKQRFPEGMDYAIALDTTRAVTEGIREIVQTLAIAILLVIVVVYIFLQGWRATLIPLLAVPVSLIGTFVFFPVFGFSINTLSLFGLVLAIGLVVDDAIVVVEAVERHIENGLAPKAAAYKAMEEISGPVIGIALVLSAVFVPTAFIPGITGRLYQQFAVTIAISVILSAFNALTLSPALAALLLKPKTESHGLLRRFFDWFNRQFGHATDNYVRWSGALIRKSGVALVMLVIFGAAAAFFSTKVPSGFLPDEDQGYVYVNLQLPNASSFQRTDEVARTSGEYSRPNAGRSRHHHCCRLQFAQPGSDQLQRLLLRDAEGLEGSRVTGAAVSDHQAAPQWRIEQDTGRHRVRLLAAGDSWSGHFRRIHVHSPGPGREGCAVPGGQPEHVHRGRQQTPRDRRLEHHVSSQRAAAVSSMWTKIRSSSKACRSTTSIGPSRHSWAACS